MQTLKGAGDSKSSKNECLTRASCRILSTHYRTGA